MTTVFLLLHDQRDQRKPFRAVGGPGILAPWAYDISFGTAVAARDQLLSWMCDAPNSEFRDLTA